MNINIASWQPEYWLIFLAVAIAVLGAIRITPSFKEKYARREFEMYFGYSPDHKNQELVAEHVNKTLMGRAEAIGHKIRELNRLISEQASDAERDQLEQDLALRKAEYQRGYKIARRFGYSNHNSEPTPDQMQEARTAS